MSGREPRPTERFSNRVAAYVRYRPAYPASVLECLNAMTGLEPSWRVADLGSGTGISTGLFLRNGNTVFAVEPNEPMRAAAEQQYGAEPGFHSTAGTAEATGLPDASVDLVVAAQAFHWFDKEKTRREIARILRPEGWVALIWNVRRTAATPFLCDYEQLLLEYSTDYEKVRHENVTDDVIGEFLSHDYLAASVYNEQTFDYAGLEGRLLSSSYAPAAGHPKHEPMLRELWDIFGRHNRNGAVKIEYDTVVHCGRVGERETANVRRETED